MCLYKQMFYNFLFFFIFFLIYIIWDIVSYENLT
jgi:hypothetical protein